MSHIAPKGFRFSGVHSGVKRSPEKQDLSLVVCDGPATAAGVYTQNRVTAAPVQLDRERTPSDRVRGVVINSGNANACTGERGLADATRMTEIAAAACGTEATEFLVLSTGIIGEPLPMDKIGAGISAAADRLAADEESLIAAARSMMTTDTVHKLADREIQVDGANVRITGMAKGAAMIGPNMATMLALIMTDAALAPDVAQAMLREVVDDTFNCIHVDGHTSTNDTVLLLASGAAGVEVTQSSRCAFQEALAEVCGDLARAIPADGEGATHLIRIDVRGCATREDARMIARTVANSLLVKTAIAGADPNWGRIVSAAGYAGVAFDPTRVDLRLNGTLIYDQGAPAAFDADSLSNSIRENRDTAIELEFSEGEATARFWTTDLTEEYVRLNADYHT